MSEEFFSLGMSTILHKCNQIIEHTDEEDVLEAVINLPVQYAVDTDRSRAHLVPGNMESPIGMIHKDGELKEAFGKQACAEFKVLEILRFYASFVVDRTDEEIDEYQRQYEKDHEDD